jgi:dipeptidase E
MKKIILTSTGFNNKKIEQKFLAMVNKPAKDIKAIWIPTAAINEDAKAMLPFCMDDLLNAGILPENIKEYNLDQTISNKELDYYDVIYVCGGDSRHLLTKMHEDNFVSPLQEFIDQGGVYIGVSAGSCICAKGFEDNLGFLPCTLSVHCEEGNTSGTIDFTQTTHINLTDHQAIILEENEAYILE